MAKTDKPRRGGRTAAPTHGRPVASAETDAESGDDGGGARQALYALEVMRERGLIGEEEYRRRKAKIEASD